MTTAPARVFAARMAGLSVFDPLGESVGRVRDLVVTLRPAPSQPRLIGLVVEVQRRRVFVAMARVRGVESGTVVLTTASLSLRAFSQRATETLALTELLDRQVRRIDAATGSPGEGVTVVDVGFEQTRTAEWLLTKVAVRGAGRRRPVEVVDTDEVTGFAAAAGTQGAANMLAAFEKLNAADLASTIQGMPPKRRREIAAALDDERLADVLEELPDDDQVQLLAGLGDERAADVLEEMPPDAAADLLGELPEDLAARLLDLMEPEEADPVRRLMAYAYDTAGGLMNNEPVLLPPNATVAEALARIRHSELPPSLAAQVYVVRPPVETPTGRYLGTAHFQRLLREPPGTIVSSVLDTDIGPLDALAPLRAVTAHLAAYNLVAAPVVDADGRLLGVVTVDDVLDHLLPDDWRER